MLQRMRGAGPQLLLGFSPFSRDARRLAGFGALVFASSCSVYSNDLLDEATAGVSQSGSDGTVAGKNSGSAGALGNGGTVSVLPPAGGEGGSPDGEGAAPNAGSATGGTVGAGGGSGTTGGSAVAGGGATTGGSGGTAATGDLVDGFEDEDITLEQTNGRGGVWYLFHDATTGTMAPSPLKCTPLTEAPAALGFYALNITATGFTDYGSGLGVDFRAGKKVYDASKYVGIRFWARVGEGKNTRHRVQIADINTDALGKKCDPAPAAVEGTKCEDHYGVQATFTTTWTQYSYRFDELSQIGWGYPGDPELKLDPSQVYGLQVTAKAKLNVDLWLDQIEFF
jgi:hypothetical protein